MSTGIDEVESAEQDDVLVDPVARSVHVYPVFGRKHDVSWDCWCHPEIDWQSQDSMIWIHKIHH